MWLNLPFLDLKEDSIKLNEPTGYNHINKANKFKRQEITAEN